MGTCAAWAGAHGQLSEALAEESSECMMHDPRYEATSTRRGIKSSNPVRPGPHRTCPSILTRSPLCAAFIKKSGRGTRQCIGDIAVAEQG